MVNRIKVWDIAVRLFHWSLVILFVVAYLTGEEHDLGEEIHAYIGYAIIGLLVFRILWGIVGTRYARFTNFVHGPATVIQYTKSMLNDKPIHYVGHNPLGGWMVIALLVSLSITSWTGLETYASEGKGPLAHTTFNLINTANADDHERERKHAHDHESDGEEFWKEIHEAFTYLTILLIVLHVTGVVIASRLHRENLVKAMLTGYKQTTEKSE